MLASWAVRLSHLGSLARQKPAAAVRRTIGMSLILALAAAEIVGTRAYLAHWRDTAGLIRNMVTLAPASAPLHFDLGLALSNQGQAAEAIAEYQTAVRLDPDFAEAHCDLGVELAKRGSTNAAVAHFRAALRSRPNDVTTHLNLGLALTQQQKFDELRAAGHVAGGSEQSDALCLPWPWHAGSAGSAVKSARRSG
jgi:Flp pilus assembly protein TadD